MQLVTRPAACDKFGIEAFLLDEKHLETAFVYNNIDHIYFIKKEFDKYIEYISLALEIVRDLNDRVKIATIEANLEYAKSHRQ